MKKKIGALILIHAILLFNLEFTAWPEMLSFPYLVNSGFSLYKDFVHPYPPLLTITLAKLYSLTGYSITALRIFTAIQIFLVDILVFLVAEELFPKNRSGLWALMFYIATQPFLEGNMLWFDTALVLPVMASLYLILRYQKSKNPNTIVLSGYFLSLAILIKQTALIYAFILFIYLLISTKKVKSLLLFAAAPVFLVTTFLLKLWAAGALSDFINWTIYYPAKYWSQFPGYVQMSLTAGELVKLSILLLPLIFLRNKFLIALVLGSLLAIYPRFSFFHFQLGIALLAVSLGSFPKKRALTAQSFFLLAIIFISLPTIDQAWGRGVRFFGQSEMALARDISEGTSDEHSIYFIGPHSGFYVLAEKVPPKPWLDNFGWYFEVPGIEAEVINKWEVSPPENVVITDKEPGEWYELGTYQPTELVSWIESNYTRERELKEGTWLWTKTR